MLYNTLPRLRAITTYRAGNRTLTSLRFNNVNYLVMITYVATCVVNVTFLIIVPFTRPDLRLYLRNIRIRQVKIGSYLVRFFYPIPALMHLCLMNMYLLFLSFFLTASSMTIRPVTSAMNGTVVLIIRLLRPYS